MEKLILLPMTFNKPISSKAVVPKLTGTVAQIKIPSMKTFRSSCRKFLFQWLLIKQNNIVVLVPRYPLKNCILTPGVIYPQFGNHCSKSFIWSSDGDSSSYCNL